MEKKEKSDFLSFHPKELEKVIQAIQEENAKLDDHGSMIIGSREKKYRIEEFDHNK